jgi:TetR/AcrR family transcriptional repressor of nem operon
MARPRQFDEDEVKEAIMNVFWEHGYEATSMQDLVAASGLLKGSLYGAFGDKQALYLLALEHYDQTHIQLAIEMLRGSDPVLLKVGRLFDSVLDSIQTTVFAGGCLLCNASIEMAAVDKGVQKMVQSQIGRLRGAITTIVEKENISHRNAQKLASFIVSTYFGSRVMAKSGLSIEAIEDTKGYCLEFVSTVLKQST